MSGADISVGEPRYDGSRIIYWFDWASIIRPNRKISYHHRHELTYHKTFKRKGCSICKMLPPEELKSIALLQQIGVVRGE